MALTKVSEQVNDSIPSYSVADADKHLAINGTGDGTIWTDQGISGGGSDAGGIEGSIQFAYDNGGNLELDGDSTFTYNSGTGIVSSTGFNSTSSIRFKDNVQDLDLESVKGKFKQLRGVSFTWKNGREDIGMIAEEVYEVFPEFVGKDNDGNITGLDYARVVSILIEVVKDLQNQIDELKG